MPVSQEGYRAFLVSNGLAEASASNYCSALRRVFEHQGGQPFTLTDLAALDAILPLYDKGGLHEAVGDVYSSAGRSALREWRTYVASELGAVTSNTPHSTYLLTWNPEHYQEGGNAGVRAGAEERWTCISSQPKPGDRVYLIRLGVAPRGMVARGTVTEGSFKAEDWRDPTKSRSYIKFLADETRPDCASGLLPMVLLDQLSQGAFKWSAQSSGIAIPDELATVLDRAWEEGRGLHSLAQCAHWYQAQTEWFNDSWKPQYLARIETVRSILRGQHDLDNATLDWLWREGANGVCTVSPGHLPNAEYEANVELLHELATLILKNPERETYERVFQRWGEAKNAGLFRQTYTAVIHRVFAAAAPERYTTLVNVQHCRALLARLARDFELPVTDSRDWIELNHAIKRALQEAGVPDSDPLDNNILVWMLYAAFFNTPADESTSESSSFRSQPTNEEPAVIRDIPLNQILFGPPGTGKTYHTINKALAILEPELLGRRDVTRAELKAAFERYVELGQVAFVTFHQSFSYEDFVEGLRAFTREDGSLEYRVEPGVFAQLCELAKRGMVVTDDPFDKAVGLLAEQTEQAEDNWLPMRTVRGNRFNARYAPDKGTFLIEQENRQGNRPPDTANIKYVRTLYMTGEKTGYNSSYVQGILDYLKSRCGLPDQAPSPGVGERKPFVLIIDEINRGNVSRIFGELITLIEPSKRAGCDEALSTTLPYSKDTFSVPDNLYIIGTMNTADRSLAGLDIALRRRFVFEEMAPRPDLLSHLELNEGGLQVNVGALLEVINQRIEVLLDRDHCLGHAYFMPLAQMSAPTVAALGVIFKNQILPLLQEYFFDDWQRIRWVLNDHRKQRESSAFLRAPAFDVTALLGNVPVNGQRQRWSVNDAAFDNIEAYVLTIEGDKEGE